MKPALVGLAALALLAGCVGSSGGDTGAGLILTPPLARDATGAADWQLGFGSVDAGHQAEHRIQLHNAGQAPLELAPIPAFPPFRAEPAEGARIPPGGKLDLTIVFAPLRAGTYESLLPLTTGGRTRWLRLGGIASAAPPGGCSIRTESELHFGRVGKNGSHALDLQLRNDGSHACNLVISIDGDGAFHAGSTLDLLPGETQPLRISVRPKAAGPLAATLHLESPGAIPSAVHLGVDAVDRCVAGPAFFDFGEAEEGCWSDRAVLALENACSHPIRLRSLSLDNTDFRIESRAVLPQLLLPGEQSEIGMRYLPHFALATRADLRVEEDAGAGLEIRLMGRGRPRMPERWRVQQGLLPDAERLYLVDDGKEGLSERIAGWAAAIQSDLPGLDARAGVTTTSPRPIEGCPASGAAGRLLPLDGSAPRLLDREQLATDQLVDRVQLPFCAAAPNEAFLAAERAIGLLRDQEGDGARRAGVTLQLVFVAGRDDASAGTLHEWFERLDALRREENLAFSAILAGEDCSVLPPGHRIATLVRLLGGEVHDLCAAPVAGRWVKRQLAWAFDTHFELPSIPFDRNRDGVVDEAGDGFALFVDGVRMPQYEGERLRYVVRQQIHAVDFDLELAPPERSIAEFVYLPECR